MQGVRSRGPWSKAKRKNHHNPCYFSHILAILHHGWIVSFRRWPKPKAVNNCDSLAEAPTAVAKEWEKMKSNDVVTPAERGSLRCVAPEQACIKYSDVEEALAELTRLGFTGDLRLDCKEGLTDRINTALRKYHSSREVKARLCADLSATLNDYIVECPFAYEPVDGLLEDIDRGSGCARWTTALFLQCAAPPRHVHIHGHLHGESLLASDPRLIRHSLGPHIASILTAETARAFRTQGVKARVYIEDIVVTAPTREACFDARDTVLWLAKRAGWPIAEDKLVADAPVTTQAFRGVGFDTIRGTNSIPVSKLAATHRGVHGLLTTAVALRVRKMRKANGRLEWINQVCPLGHIHTKRLHDTIPRGASTKWRMRLSSDARDDLRWWDACLQEAVRGEGIMHWARFDRALLDAPVVRLFCDASGKIGFGATALDCILGGLWVSAGAVEHLSSSWKELVPVCLMLQHIVPQLAPGTVIVVTTDNESNSFMYNNVSCDSPESFELLAYASRLALDHQMLLLGDWVPREHNELNDCSLACPPCQGASKMARTKKSFLHMGAEEVRALKQRTGAYHQKAREPGTHAHTSGTPATTRSITSVASLDNALSAIRCAARERGCELSEMQEWYLKRVCRGLRKTYRATTKRKRPMTLDVLLDFVLKADCTKLGDLQLLTMAFLAHDACLRAAELLVLHWSDIGWELDEHGQPLVATITIRVSKARHDKGAETVRIPRYRVASRNACGVQFLWVYMHVSGVLKRQQGNLEACLFPTRKSSTQPMSKTGFREQIRQRVSAAGYQAKEFSGHSFRAGGVTDLHIGGCPEVLARLLGRWRSRDAYLRYIREHPDLQAAQLCRAYETAYSQQALRR